LSLDELRNQYIQLDIAMVVSHMVVATFEADQFSLADSKISANI